MGYVLANRFGLRIFCGGCVKEQFGNFDKSDLLFFVFSQFALHFEFIIDIFTSECLGLHANFAPNPSRHLPGPSTAINKYCLIPRANFGSIL